MIQEDKELLLTDLCGRFRYCVKFRYFSEFADGEDPEFDNTITVIDVANEAILDEDHEDYIPIRQIMPYLRPMSSMTEEEEKEYWNIDNRSYSCPMVYAHVPASDRIDWLNKNMFDYRGLIKKGLALEAPEGMYNSQNE